jgi:hypothetical protein
VAVAFPQETRPKSQQLAASAIASHMRDATADDDRHSRGSEPGVSPGEPPGGRPGLQLTAQVEEAKREAYRAVSRGHWIRLSMPPAAPEVRSKSRDCLVGRALDHLTMSHVEHARRLRVVPPRGWRGRQETGDLGKR